MEDDLITQCNLKSDELKLAVALLLVGNLFVYCKDLIMSWKFSSKPQKTMYCIFLISHGKGHFLPAIC